MKWGHNQLAEDLALAIGGMPFLDVPLGSVVLSSGKAQRADVVGIKPSYTRFAIAIYEVKVSRADFLSDIRSEKWKGYLDHCHRFYFAVQSGICSKDEIPHPAGLIVRGEKGWVTIKGAKPMETEIPVDTLMSLIFNKTKLDTQYRRQAEQRYWIQKLRSRDYKDAAKLFGKKVGEAIRAKEMNFTSAKDYKYAVEEITELVNMIRKELGLETKSYIWTWDVEKRLEEIKKGLGR